MVDCEHDWTLVDRLEWLYRCANCQTFGRRFATGLSVSSRMAPRKCVHKGCGADATIRLHGRLPAGRLRLVCAAHEAG